MLGQLNSISGHSGNSMEHSEAIIRISNKIKLSLDGFMVRDSKLEYSV